MPANAAPIGSSNQHRIALPTPARTNSSNRKERSAGADNTVDNPPAVPARTANKAINRAARAADSRGSMFRVAFGPSGAATACSGMGVPNNVLIRHS